MTRAARKRLSSFRTCNSNTISTAQSPAVRTQHALSERDFVGPHTRIPGVLHFRTLHRNEPTRIVGYPPANQPRKLAR